MKRLKTEKGITLIALIITIVVLLILAVVTINSIQGDGIIQYASNAADEYTAKANEEQANSNTLFDQIEGSLSEEEAAWTKISEGDLAIGSTVKHIETEEEFYVIGGDTAGTPITSSTEKVLLLAKNNLKADGSAQDPNGATNECAFSSTNYWSSETSYPADLNDTEKYPIPEGETSIVTIAKTYGASLGATGRLMTVEEVEALGGSRDSESTKDCPDFINSTEYWLGSARGTSSVWSVYGGIGSLLSFSFGTGIACGVRPVVEILKSDIS